MLFRLKPVLLPTLAVLWLFAMLVLYYSGHKPFNAALLLSLLLALGRLAIALILVGLAGGVGCYLLRDAEWHPLARMALQAAIGLGVFSLGLLLIGGLIGLSRSLLWALMGFLAAILWRKVLTWGRQAAALVELWRAGSRFERTLAGLLSALVLLALLIALAPPLGFDALMYHLVMPGAYLRAGRVEVLPWIVMTGHPQNAEMLYTWAIALGGNQAATVLGWTWSLLALIGLLGYLRQRLERQAAWVGVAALLGGYSLVIQMAEGYVDWLGLLFGLGGLACLDLWRQHGRRLDALYAGLFAGLALGTKYPAGVLGLVGLGALAWHAWRGRYRFLPGLLSYALGGLTALPWLVKNLLTTGNPLYPFFFASGAMDWVRINSYQGMPPWGNWLDFFFLPVRAMVLGFDNGPGYGVAQGPLLLGLGALSWLGWKGSSPEKRASLENAAVLALLGWLVWAVGNRLSGFLLQTRFYFSLFPAFALLAAAGFSGLSRLNLSQVRVSRLAQALVLLVLVFNLAEVGAQTVRLGALPYLLGQRSLQAYLADNLGWFQPPMQAINELPESAKVLLLFETRSLYCLPRCYPDEILDRWKREWVAQADPQAILQSWRAQGFTHILYYKTGADFMRQTGDPHYTQADWQALDEFLAQLPPPENFGDVYWLYSIASTP